MKKRNLLAALFASIAIFSSCEKNNSECELTPAKIIRYDCDRVIFQMLTSDSFGDSNWEDVQTGIRYNNVFSYYNTCEITALTKGKMDTLYVNLKEPEINPAIGDCYRCQAISQAPPQTKVTIVEISKSPCQPSE